MFTLNQIGGIASERAYSTNAVDIILQGTLHSLLLPLVPQDKHLPDCSFYHPEFSLGKPKRAP